jgi:hypothetical protein
LKKMISGIGIPLVNLQVADANADYVKVRWQKKDVLSKKEYNLKVSNATTLGKVFMELETVEVSDAYIYKVGHSRMDSLTKVVKIEAIQSAKNKAQYLLTAIGEQLGQPLIIHETMDLPSALAGSVRGTRTGSTQYYVDGIRVKGGGDDNEIQFQKIKISADIYIKFAIRE